jgi:hypothetical protein
MIGAFLDELGGANQAAAPTPAAPARNLGQRRAAVVDKIMEKAMPAPPDAGLTEESAQMERYRQISRSIFG